MAMTGVARVTGSARNLMQGFDAVDAGQLDVHQNEGWLSLVGKAHALFAGLGLDGLVPLDLERIPHQLQVLGVVFDNKNQLIRHDTPGL